MKQLRETIRNILLENASHAAKIGNLLSEDDPAYVRQAIELGETIGMFDTTERSLGDNIDKHLGVEITEVFFEILYPDFQTWVDTHFVPKKSTPWSGGKYTTAQKIHPDGTLVITFIDALEE